MALGFSKDIQLAEFLGVSAQAIYQARKKDKVPDAWLIRAARLGDISIDALLNLSSSHSSSAIANSLNNGIDEDLRCDEQSSFDLARYAQSVQEHYQDRDFQYVEILTQGNDPTQRLGAEQLSLWATEADLQTIPVLDGGQLVDLFEIDGNLPTIVHIGPDLRVLAVDENITDPGFFFQ